MCPEKFLHVFVWTCFGRNKFIYCLFYPWGSYI